jgi:hypothetical protein
MNDRANWSRFIFPVIIIALLGWLAASSLGTGSDVGP